MEDKIEAGKWNITFLDDPNKDLDQSYKQLIFRLKKHPNQIMSIPEEDLQQLKEDLLDLGKWREFKKLKKDLNN